MKKFPRSPRGCVRNILWVCRPWFLEPCGLWRGVGRPGACRPTCRSVGVLSQSPHGNSWRGPCGSWPRPPHRYPWTRRSGGSASRRADWTRTPRRPYPSTCSSSPMRAGESRHRGRGRAGCGLRVSLRAFRHDNLTCPQGRVQARGRSSRLRPAEWTPRDARTASTRHK